MGGDLVGDLGGVVHHKLDNGRVRHGQVSQLHDLDVLTAVAGVARTGNHSKADQGSILMA